MKTLCVSTEKGGTGKTLTAFHAAHYFAAQGLRTLLIDFDAQQAAVSEMAQAHASSAGALHMFAEADGVAIPPTGKLTLAPRTRQIEAVEHENAEEMVSNFAASLRLCAETYDVAVIDCPPASGVRTITALLSSDMLVAPILLHEASLSAVQSTLDHVEAVCARFNKVAPDWMRYRPLLVNNFNTRSPEQRQWFSDLAHSVGKIVIDGKIVTRDAYARTWAAGVPVWDLRDSAGRVSSGIKAASEEMRGAMGEVERMMEISK